MNMETRHGTEGTIFRVCCIIRPHPLLLLVLYIF
ncbi:hypothetical protein E2C01_037308 [Portunus trituberculatus]|uniref:Uncharacterized protein n=1 Tax=Portunus trituberculatus TaxID=210409 RepID=A0A5B7FDN2_PORTR|nr:hypothetical protein [Portunus trituberculatus]